MDHSTSKQAQLPWIAAVVASLVLVFVALAFARHIAPPALAAIKTAQLDLQIPPKPASSAVAWAVSGPRAVSAGWGLLIASTGAVVWPLAFGAASIASRTGSALLLLGARLAATIGFVGAFIGLVLIPAPGSLHQVIPAVAVVAWLAAAGLAAKGRVGQLAFQLLFLGSCALPLLLEAGHRHLVAAAVAGVVFGLGSFFSLALLAPGLWTAATRGLSGPSAPPGSG